MPRLLCALALLAAPAARADDLSSAEKAAVAAVAKLRGKAAPDDNLDPAARLAVTLPTATDASFTLLGKHPAVGAVEVADASKLTVKGVTALATLPNVQKLVLNKPAGLSAKAAEAIGGMKTLRVLFLGESKLTDAAVAGLGPLADLRTLDLTDAKITDKSVPVLAGLGKLEDLNLSGTDVTDAGVGGLKAVKGLKLLRLHRTNVTREGVEGLEKELPKLTVRW